MKIRRIAIAAVTVASLGLAAWGAQRFYSSILSTKSASLPETRVRRGDVVFTVSARGELQGGNTEMLFAPMTGGGGIAITVLRESGELVNAGDVVVQFDTTEQEYKLREAEADLAEAEQKVAEATAESLAKEEEARYALIEARSELRVAELETRRNELVARIVARQNDLAVAAARDKVNQLEKDLPDRLDTARAGIAIQDAARTKAQVAAATARRNIESMTLKAKTGGYVARQQNTQGDFRWGSYLPALQVGDTVRAGMAVAQIPDLHNWEASARIGELDRGHIAVGQQTGIEVVALPGRRFSGKVKIIGGTTGPPWDRHFETKVALTELSPELRPGMSVRLKITTDTLRNALWLPAQALFESDGRKFVYLKTGRSFTPHDVKLVRRSESQVVLEGLNEGQVVALANPDQMKQKPAAKSGAAEAIQR
jgi:multidrug efflux pump subunit AcrA (membrane-fusion protein)